VPAKQICRFKFRLQLETACALIADYKGCTRSIKTIREHTLPGFGLGSANRSIRQTRTSMGSEGSKGFENVRLCATNSVRSQRLGWDVSTLSQSAAKAS